MKRIMKPGTAGHAFALKTFSVPLSAFELIWIPRQRSADYGAAQLAARKARDKARAKAKSAARRRGGRK
jgi:hypothetical protein